MGFLISLFKLIRFLFPLVSFAIFVRGLVIISVMRACVCSDCNFEPLELGNSFSKDKSL